MARLLRWERRRVGVSTSLFLSISTSSSDVGTTAVACSGALVVEEAVERAETAEVTVDGTETVEGTVEGTETVEMEVLRVEVDVGTGAGAGTVNMSGGYRE